MIPMIMTPPTSRTPHQLNHTWLATLHTEATMATSTTSSATRITVSNRSSARMPGGAHRRRGARSRRSAAAVEAPESRNARPSRFVSLQTGRFVTLSSTPVYPATKNPKRPPMPGHTTPSGCGGRNAERPRHRMRPSSASAATNETKANSPETISHSQRGAAVKRLSGSPLVTMVLLPPQRGLATRPEAHEAEQPDEDGPDRRPDRARHQVAGGQRGIRRKVVHLRTIDEQEERVETTQR